MKVHLEEIRGLFFIIIVFNLEENRQDIEKIKNINVSLFLSQNPIADARKYFNVSIHDVNPFKLLLCMTSDLYKTLTHIFLRLKCIHACTGVRDIQ